MRSSGSELDFPKKGMLLACGGWGKRKTQFGGDQYAQRGAELLDPRSDAANMRAFFGHPDWARRGIGRAMLYLCESDARANGFKSLELMGTQPGVKLYRTLGFVGHESVSYGLGIDITIEFVPMHKEL